MLRDLSWLSVKNKAWNFVKRLLSEDSQEILSLYLFEPRHEISKTNSMNLYPPTKGYVREMCKSQNINPIYLNLKFTFGIIQIIANAGQGCV